ncbi:non-ribosomal peptide synthetase, partial [Pseudomonas syringae]
MNSFEKNNTAPSRSQDLAMRAGAQHITGTEGPLSMSQEQAWFLETLVPESIAYNFQAMLNIRGNLDINVLERALNRVVERHQSLSTVFDEVDGEPRQTIQDAWSVNIPIVDLSASSEAVRQTYMNSIVKAEIAQKIEVAKLPLIRWVLFKFSDQFHVLLHIEHHLIHDGWSFRLFLKELNHFYNEEKG